MPEVDYKFALPFVLEFLSPNVVTYIGLGAISAAIMSSSDASLLSVGCIFIKHVYAPIREIVSSQVCTSLVF